MPSGLLVPERLAYEIAEDRRRLLAVDVFAGGGGFSLGAIQGGLEVVAAIEYDTNCILTYASNLCRWGQVQFHFVEPSDEERMEKAIWKAGQRASKEQLLFSFPVCGDGWIAHQPASVPGVSHVICGDVRKLTGERLLNILGMEKGELGCIFGGPPCQGFTRANRNRRPDDPRNQLLFEFARLIVEVQPRSLIMENVPEVATMIDLDGIPILQKFLRVLQDGGFHGVEAIERLAQKHGTAVAFPRRSSSPRRAPKAKAAA